MTVDTAFERLRQANPEPDPAALRRQLQQASQPHTTWKEMTLETQTTDIEAPSPARQGRKWLPAFATAILAVVVLGGLLTLGRDGTIFGGPSTPVEIAERYMEARNAWDAKAADRLLAADASLSDVPIMGRDELELGFEALRVYEFQFDPFECTEVRSGSPAIVTCSYQMETSLQQIVDYPPVAGSFRFTIADGQITRLLHNFPFNEYSPNVFEKYVGWLVEEHPGIAEQLFRDEGGTTTPILTPEALELAAEYIRLYDQSVNGAGG